MKLALSLMLTLALSPVAFAELITVPAGPIYNGDGHRLNPTLESVAERMLKKAMDPEQASRLVMNSVGRAVLDKPSFWRGARWLRVNAYVKKCEIPKSNDSNVNRVNQVLKNLGDISPQKFLDAWKEDGQQIQLRFNQLIQCAEWISQNGECWAYAQQPTQREGEMTITSNTCPFLREIKISNIKATFEKVGDTQLNLNIQVDNK